MPSITVQTAQAAVLSATSNILAQALTAYRENKTFQLALEPIYKFVLFTILNTPINILWQRYLEETFPGSKPASSTPPAQTKEVGEKDAYKNKAVASKDVASKRNIATKFLLDQTIGAAFNTALFFIGMGLLNGNTWEQCISTMKRDSFSLYVAGAKIWPAVSLISFIFIPVERRVLFASIIGVGWGVYLSLLAA
ncbi:integral membrane protein-like protein [Patellaria atrata CBS 101060]|uniref:Integral membrane protein-like protein n=1 Tax=Patellaria atrata CBS 101060 TaxID=1346257 RepID=A0A9P4VTP2_9PEZI|nr:integral membrane protein-like protein [Patellaria atrata CBS 101060]